MGSERADVGGVNATETTLDIIERIHQHGSGRVTVLARELGLAKSTVHNHLQTLRRRGYVIQDGDEYRLSLRFLHLGQGVRTSRTAYQLVKEKVEWLADETGERSQFIVEEQGCGVYMFCELGTDGVQTDSGSASASRSTRPPRARPSSLHFRTPASTRSSRVTNSSDSRTDP